MTGKGERKRKLFSILYFSNGQNSQDWAKGTSWVVHVDGWIQELQMPPVAVIWVNIYRKLESRTEPEFEPTHSNIAAGVSLTSVES